MNMKAVVWGIVWMLNVCAVSGCWFSSDSDADKKKQQSQGQQAPNRKAEVKNAADLIAWIKIKNKQTELQRKESFAKFKNKYVVFKGNVRNVGKTAFGGKTYVSLRVDKLNMFENINIQFNVPDALKDTVAAWMKNEVYVMRGQVTGSGDLEDDAVCSNASVVDDAKYAEVAPNAVCEDVKDVKSGIRESMRDALNGVDTEKLESSVGDLKKTIAEGVDRIDTLKGDLDELKRAGDELKRAGDELKSVDSELNNAMDRLNSFSL